MILPFVFAVFCCQTAIYVVSVYAISTSEISEAPPLRSCLLISLREFFGVRLDKESLAWQSRRQGAQCSGLSGSTLLLRPLGFLTGLPAAPCDNRDEAEKALFDLEYLHCLQL